MVYLAVPRVIRADVSAALREAVTISLPQTVGGTISLDANEVLKEYVEKAERSQLVRAWVATTKRMRSSACWLRTPRSPS